MKTILLVLIAIFAMTTIATAQKPIKLTLKHSQHKVERKTGLTVTFVSVDEDSRCPVGVNCIWAGNAKIQVKVSDKRGSKLMTMNTTVGPLGDQYGGWAVNLVSLTPLPTVTGKPDTKRYTATFSIERLSR